MLDFGLICPKVMSQKSHGLFRFSSANISCSVMSFLERVTKRFPGNPAKQAILVQPFTNCTVMNFNMPTKAFTVWDASLEFLAISLTIEMYLLGYQ